MSTPPNDCSAVEISASAVARSAILPATNSALAPRPRISASVSATASFSARSLTTTEAPARASASASALPRPAPAPVTRATRPAKLRFVSLTGPTLERVPIGDKNGLQQLQRRLRALRHRVLDLGAPIGGHLLGEDVQLVVVVEFEHVGGESDTDSVRLALVQIDADLHDYSFTPDYAARLQAEAGTRARNGRITRQYWNMFQSMCNYRDNVRFAPGARRHDTRSHHAHRVHAAARGAPRPVARLLRPADHPGTARGAQFHHR